MDIPYLVYSWTAPMARTHHATVARACRRCRHRAFHRVRISSALSSSPLANSVGGHLDSLVCPLTASMLLEETRSILLDLEVASPKVRHFPSFA